MEPLFNQSRFQKLTLNLYSTLLSSATKCLKLNIEQMSNLVLFNLVYLYLSQTTKILKLNFSVNKIYINIHKYCKKIITILIYL